MVDEITSKAPVWKSLAMLLLGVGTVVLCLSAPATVTGDSAGVVLELPDTVLHMRGKKEEASEAEKEILPVDTGILKKRYDGRAANGSRDMVSCTIVLSASDQRSLHRPEVCLPGQGWTIDSTEVVPIEMKSGEKLKVKKLGLSQEREVAKGKLVKYEAIYLYWYVGKDVTTPSTMERVMISAVDNVFRNVNHRWAYASVLALVTEDLQEGGRGPEETMRLAEDFVREAAPAFQKTF